MVFELKNLIEKKFLHFLQRMVETKYTNAISTAKKLNTESVKLFEFKNTNIPANTPRIKTTRIHFSSLL